MQYSWPQAPQAAQKSSAIMAAFQSRPGPVLPDSPDETQAKAIWQMSQPSLSSNNNELLLPPHMAAQLSKVSIDELKLRLSRYLGGISTLAFLDRDRQVFRICEVPQLLETQATQTAAPSSPSAMRAIDSQSSAPQPLVVKKTRASAKKIPRPPNAFILYRKEHHLILKERDPEIQNNEISIIVGRKWKAEPELVKERYRMMAENLKRQHAVDNPDYQYTPRKPSEKKRRMTARKMAQLEAAILQQNSRAGPVQDDEEFKSEQAETLGVRMLDTERSQHRFGFPARSSRTAQGLLGTARPDLVSHLMPNESERLVISLPTGGNHTLPQEVEDYSGRVDPSSAHSLNLARNSFTTRTATHVTNDDDFFNSLVDWEAVVADVALIRGATAEEMVELDDVELGNPYALLSGDGHLRAFEDELDR